MLNHERKRKNKENANFVHIVYLLVKLCNIFDEAFFIDVSIFSYCINRVRFLLEERKSICIAENDQFTFLVHGTIRVHTETSMATL